MNIYLFTVAKTNIHMTSFLHPVHIVASVLGVHFLLMIMWPQFLMLGLVVRVANNLHDVPDLNMFHAIYRSV